VTTEGEADVMLSLQRKAAQADKMFDSLIQHMNESLRIERTNPYTTSPEVPSWL
jgi:hypothetical protein